MQRPLMSKKELLAMTAGERYALACQLLAELQADLKPPKGAKENGGVIQ